MSDRQNVTWRVSKDPQKDKLNKWCDAQHNIQDSISNLVLHMIEKFGYRDIKDYDIQKDLYKICSSDKANTTESLMTNEFILNDEITDNISDSVNKEQTINTDDKPQIDKNEIFKEGTKKIVSNDQNNENDLYDEIDLSTL